MRLKQDGAIPLAIWDIDLVSLLNLTLNYVIYSDLIPSYDVTLQKNHMIGYQEHTCMYTSIL